jgi:hypothetical protein
MAIPLFAWPAAFIMILMTVGFIALSYWRVLSSRVLGRRRG